MTANLSMFTCIICWFKTTISNNRKYHLVSTYIPSSCGFPFGFSCEAVVGPRLGAVVNANWQA